ncbi:MAG: 23S rRNA (adenine(2503)-C(2))-methyltransferase RlmN [Bacillota bacterium]
MNIKALSFDEIESFIKDLGEPRFRARQVIDWLFVKGVATFDAMTNLPLSLRQRLSEAATLSVPEILRRHASGDGKTIKYLLRLHDGETVETVFMHRSWGRTACVSTQAGCRMGCSFCASGIGGLSRNLTAGEIYDQVLFTQIDSGMRVSHVVLMGTGEPFDNLDNTIRFLKNITNPLGLGIGARHITVSTCGVVPGIYALAGLELQVGLAVSLHAPNDGLRSRLLPINRRYPLKALIPACREYINKTGRRVTFEYTLVSGVNDGKKEAEELADLLRGLLCHVNLIPLNRVLERRFEAPTPERVAEFEAVLARNGLAVTVRREIGSGISAACGQLRKRYRTEQYYNTSEP